MRDRHAPHDEFVERLEAEIGREVRRRNTLVESSRLVHRWSLRHALALAAVAVVSMAIGGGVVAAAYEARSSQQRDQVSAGYERRVALARQRLTLAEQDMAAAERELSLGISDQEAVSDARVKLTEAQSTLNVLELQLQEIRLTSREPGAEISSPLVSGRDFVSERLKIEMTVPAAALDAEKVRLKLASTRASLGVASPADVDRAMVRVAELEAAVTTFQRKLDIRQRFLKGEYDAATAELRAFEVSASLRREALARQIALSQEEFARLDQRVRMGVATQVERSQAQLRLLQLQTELAELDVQLAMVQTQNAQRKGK